MTITEFAKSRNIEPQAVSRYLNRHDELKKQCQKEGKSLILSDDVLRVLDEKYPLPKPTIVVQGVPEEEHREALEKLLQAQEVIIKLQSELAEQKLLIAESETQRVLLEDRERRAADQVAELQKENDRLRNRSFWDRVLNRR